MSLLLALFLLGCHKHEETADTRPPEVCHDPQALPTSPYFTDATADWGLTDIRGNRLTAVDYDNDGWTDLLVSAAATNPSNYVDGDTHVNYLLHNDHGTFSDATEASGITAAPDGTNHRAFMVASWGDVDNDGDLDLFTGYFVDRNSMDAYPGWIHEVLLNDGDGTFTLAPESDASYQSAVSGATMLDYDHDGVLDLFVVGWYQRYGYLPAEQAHLLQGGGDGQFYDVTTDSGLLRPKSASYPDDYLDGKAARPAYGTTSCDVDGDGWADLLQSNYGRSWNEQWINHHDGTFTDVAMSSGYAADDDLDYSDNEFYKCYCQVEGGCDPDPGPAAIDCSTYSWTPGFDDQPARLAGNTFTTACGDVDNDGDLDLYSAEIAHWHIGDSSDRSELLENDGSGNFTRPGNDATGLARPREADWNEGDLMASLLDFDDDGWKDILLNASDYPDNHAHLWHQTSADSFEDVSETSGLDQDYASGVAVADFDNDGDLDVILGMSTARGLAPEALVSFYRNDLPAANSATIELVGTDANRSAYGAKVTVEAGGLTQTYELNGSYGHMGMQNDTVLHVGLGSACDIDKITVQWPDKSLSTDTYEDVRGNYRVRLTQGGDVEYLGEQ